jgi:hypothetical protein
VTIRNAVDAIASVGRRAYIRVMNTFLVILLIAAMVATVVALVRGVVSFLQEGSAQAECGFAEVEPDDAAADLLPGAGDPDRGGHPVRSGTDLGGA